MNDADARTVASLRKLADLIEARGLPTDLSIYVHGYPDSVSESVHVETVAQFIAWADAIGVSRARAAHHRGQVQLHAETGAMRLTFQAARIPGMVIPPQGWTFHVDLLRIAEAVKAA